MIEWEGGLIWWRRGSRGGVEGGAGVSAMDEKKGRDRGDVRVHCAVADIEEPPKMFRRMQ